MGLLNQLLLELLGKYFSARQLIMAYLGQVSKSVGRYRPAIGIFDAESLKWNALLADISCRAWRMFVAVFCFKVFCSDVSVFEDMFNHSPGAFVCYGLQALNKFFWVFTFSHEET
jgi:hypothetical protein